jgi:glutamate-1-semialdehyde 2,1-aminomutase
MALAREMPLPAIDQKSSAELFSRAEQVMPSGYTRDLVAQKPHPQYADHAEGCWLYDVDGGRRIDWVNNFASMIHGHCRPEIVEVVSTQAGRLLSAVLPTEWEVKLAELLCARIASVEKVRFTNSGTEANMIAVKAARAFTGKSKIAKMEGGYHGQYDLLEASFQPQPPGWGDADRPVATAHNPGTPQSLLSELVILPLNDLANARAILRAQADEIAAVILDPWRLQLGLVPVAKDFLEMLREETDALGIVLIFDEVVSLRAGYTGAQGRRGVTPDLTTMGKIIGGGLPVGGIGGKGRFMSVFEMERGDNRVKHSGTFTANPMSMAAGYTSMQLLTPAAFNDLERKCERVREALARAHRDAKLPGRVTGDASVTELMLIDMPMRNYREAAAAMRAGLSDTFAKLQREFAKEQVFMMRGTLIGSTAMREADIDLTIEAGKKVLARMAAL